MLILPILPITLRTRALTAISGPRTRPLPGTAVRRAEQHRTMRLITRQHSQRWMTKAVAVAGLNHGKDRRDRLDEGVAGGCLAAVFCTASKVNCQQSNRIS